MNKHLPKWLWAIITIAGILSIGVLDGLTGYELNFFVFYFLPLLRKMSRIFLYTVC